MQRTFSHRLEAFALRFRIAALRTAIALKPYASTTVGLLVLACACVGLWLAR